jgi:hypothetical protein
MKSKTMRSAWDSVLAAMWEAAGLLGSQPHAELTEVLPFKQGYQRGWGAFKSFRDGLDGRDLTGASPVKQCLSGLGPLGAKVPNEKALYPEAPSYGG